MSNRTPLSPDTRRDVLQRDKSRCQECGEPVGPKALDFVRTWNIHHKTPVAEGGSDDKGNLVTLCVGCHKIRHQGPLHLAVNRAVRELGDGFTTASVREKVKNVDTRVRGEWVLSILENMDENDELPASWSDRPPEPEPLTKREQADKLEKFAPEFARAMRIDAHAEEIINGE